jgi:hypothetical protein
MTINRNDPLLNKKIFSFNDLIDMGLITQKQIEDYMRMKKAEQTVRELFPGMF